MYVAEAVGLQFQFNSNMVVSSKQISSPIISTIFKVKNAFCSLSISFNKLFGISYFFDNSSYLKFVGKEKKRMETWRIEKEFYKCSSCNYEWDEVFERNIDLESRPKPKTKRLKERAPNDLF